MSIFSNLDSKSRLWSALLLPAFLVLLMVLSIWSDLQDFNNKAPYIEAVGTVANLDCDNHGQYEATFSAGGLSFTRSAMNSFLRASCRDLSAGQPIPVWHSAHDPGYVSFVSPEQALSSMRGEILQLLFFVYPFMAGFLFIALHFSSQNRKTA